MQINDAAVNNSAGKVNKFEKLAIGSKCLDIPFIQGGMGIGISLGNLAGAVAACGGMGTISAALPGFDDAGFADNSVEVSRNALAREIKKAREISGGRGMIAVNIMAAQADYKALVKTAEEAGADAIVSGAGLPKELPGLVGDILIAPIVSSGRAANIICRLWEKQGRLPDFVILENAAAGGHLGFSEDELADYTGMDKQPNTCKSDEETQPNTCKSEIYTFDLIKEVKEALKPYEEKAGRKIPLIFAGGIRDKKDAAKALSLGADGIQLATEFAVSIEGDATDAYKKVLLGADNEKLQIIKSPVGLPGRALKTPLIEKVSRGERCFRSDFKCRGCLRACKRENAPYCISDALIAAWYGDLENGLFFTGDKIGLLNENRSAAEIISSFMDI